MQFSAGFEPVEWYQNLQYCQSVPLECCKYPGIFSRVPGRNSEFLVLRQFFGLLELFVLKNGNTILDMCFPYLQKTCSLYKYVRDCIHTFSSYFQFGGSSTFTLLTVHLSRKKDETLSGNYEYGGEFRYISQIFVTRFQTRF